MTDRLPPRIAEQVRELPEFRMGVHRIGVRLISGEHMDDVLVSAERVTKVIGRDDVPFDAAEVVEIEDQHDWKLPTQGRPASRHGESAETQ